VDSFIPDQAPRGTTLDVRVLGSGFDDGSQVNLEMDGLTTGAVRTNSTRFVSPQELVANITIAADAEPGIYQVVVIARNGKRGIGLEGFTISVVVVGTLPGRIGAAARDVNGNGEVVGLSSISCPDDPCSDGNHAFYWDGGAIEDLGPGIASSISEMCGVGGCRVVGVDAGRPVVWEKMNGSWTRQELPTRTGSGSVHAISGRGDQAVGSMALEGGRGTAVVWTESGGAWTLTELSPSGSSAWDINEIGQVTGTAQGQPVVWTPAGAGWTVQGFLEPLPGDAFAEARAINNLGDVVGWSGLGSLGTDRSRAVVWRRAGTGWSEPIDLIPPGSNVGITASTASDINDKGQIVGTAIDERLEFTLRQKGFLWIETLGLVDLGVFEGRGTTASAISEGNQIAGSNTEVALRWTFTAD
jgi:probable HAF family extracellular repeat protein